MRQHTVPMCFIAVAALLSGCAATPATKSSLLLTVCSSEGQNFKIPLTANGNALTPEYATCTLESSKKVRFKLNAATAEFHIVVKNTASPFVDDPDPCPAGIPQPAICFQAPLNGNTSQRQLELTNGYGEYQYGLYYNGVLTDPSIIIDPQRMFWLAGQH